MKYNAQSVESVDSEESLKTDPPFILRTGASTVTAHVPFWGQLQGNTGEYPVRVSGLFGSDIQS